MMDGRYVAWLTQDWQLSQTGLDGVGGIGYINSGRCDKATNQYVADADLCEIALRWALSANHKGQLYILGDEPDLYNVNPVDYLAWYNKDRARLKEADPTCKVSIAGIAQPNSAPCDWGHGLDYLNALWQASGRSLQTDQLRCHCFDWWSDNLATWKNYINSWRSWRDANMPGMPVVLGSFGYPDPSGPDQTPAILAKMQAALDWLETTNLAQWYWWEWDGDMYGEPNCLWKNGQLTPCGKIWAARAIG